METSSNGPSNQPGYAFANSFAACHMCEYGSADTLSCDSTGHSDFSQRKIASRPLKRRAFVRKPASISENAITTGAVSSMLHPAPPNCVSARYCACANSNESANASRSSSKRSIARFLARSSRSAASSCAIATSAGQRESTTMAASAWSERARRTGCSSSSCASTSELLFASSSTTVSAYLSSCSLIVCTASADGASCMSMV
mmetsp:Transcript_19788/g.50327  ORF Transcript_19788/g.50327 Transcript_19788/m.50327 type:complete len:202 (-) Transcript_19788:156-761(-)